MIILSIFLGLSIIFNCVLIYGIKNLYKKLEVYESWISYFGKEIDNLYQSVKLIDHKGIFEKDDEVGFIYSEIVRVIEEFNNKIK